MASNGGNTTRRRRLVHLLAIPTIGCGYLTLTNAVWAFHEANLRPLPTVILGGHSIPAYLGYMTYALCFGFLAAIAGSEWWIHAGTRQ